MPSHVCLDTNVSLRMRNTITFTFARMASYEPLEATPGWWARVSPEVGPRVNLMEWQATWYAFSR